MSSSVVLGVALPLIYLVAAVGLWSTLLRERRNPTSYSRRPEVLASWREMSAAEQEAYDNAALDAAESAESVAARASSLYKS
ncbi:hypothetical protein [Streptomyces africanus]|uniref:hypothetical protein n=1 Tax=Streptomyces africanus TaxID=231024 RepID=UPI000A366FFC|nr:hypothetical protein [Streptomyces africanus]